MKRRKIMSLLLTCMLMIASMSMVANAEEYNTKLYELGITEGDIVIVEATSAMAGYCHCGFIRIQTTFYRVETGFCPTDGSSCDTYYIYSSRIYDECPNTWCNDSWFTPWVTFWSGHE